MEVLLEPRDSNIDKNPALPINKTTSRLESVVSNISLSGLRDKCLIGLLEASSDEIVM